MKSIILENDLVHLKVNPAGGSYTNFHLKDLPLNPLNWSIDNPDLPQFEGHFLCFDRWGPPSEAEKHNGFQHHGEVNTQIWTVLDKPNKKEENTACIMRCRLPIGNLEITRHVELQQKEPVFIVTEKIKNLNKYGRMYNIVQHATLAPPFLSFSTLFDNNTEQGFEDKEDGTLEQEKPIFKWYEGATYKKKKINFRQFQNDWPRVSTFAYPKNEKFGWITAANPLKNLLIGYIWRTTDYPWINFWRDMKKGVPLAFGIEFGTTGLHEPFPVVAKKGKIFNRNIYEFIDAGEVIHKSFAGFLAKIPDDYQGVEKIQVDKSAITLREKRKKSRDITYQLNL